MMVSVDLLILMGVLAVAVMALDLIGHFMVVGLVIMVDMELMTSVVVLGAMVVVLVLVLVAMQAAMESHLLDTQAAMDLTWAVLVVDMVVVG